MTRFNSVDDSVIGRELARLRGEAPFPVDVTDLVLSRIADRPLPMRSDVRVKHLAWALAAAGSAAAAVAGGVALRAEAVRASIAEMVSWSYRVGRAMLELGTPIAGALRGTGRAARAVVDALLAYGASLRSHDEAMIVASLTAAAAMVATAVFLVGRDLRGRLVSKEH